MAGLTEKRGENQTDSFWTWRRLMYRFLDRITPEQVQAIAALVQMEMLEPDTARMSSSIICTIRRTARPMRTSAKWRIGSRPRRNNPESG